VCARDLRKVYRLYERPRDRLWDMLGVLSSGSGRYREHTALDGVSFDVAVGEKVAFIGRNGAGKSTLLKLVAHSTLPTSGTLQVRGETQALLQIGTGFHPDLTGRENALAYLAHIGVLDQAARDRIDEIVDFAELEEYIDQPLKTYSTGMGMRLMFATATTVAPSLLIVDEVLGVGDAYFSRKSFERIDSLCRRDGTTLLLVTHDIYSASKLCDRMLWLDRGRVMVDGASADVIKVYEDSIRVQEEQRLRLKRLSSLRRSRLLGGAGVLVEVRAHSNRPQPCPVYFSEISLWSAGRELARLPLDASDATSPSELQFEGASWGEPCAWRGESCRPMLNYGSVFHKVAGLLCGSASAAATREPAPFQLRVRYVSERPCDLLVRCSNGERESELGPLPPSNGEWITHVFDWPLAGGSDDVAHEASAAGSYGTGDVLVRNAGFVDEQGCERDILQHGQAAILELRYEIVNPTLASDVQVVVALHRDGTHDVCRFIGREIPLGSSAQCGTIVLRIPSVDLTDGRYTVTILVTRAGYYDSPQAAFYTINPDVYCGLSRLFEISIVGSGLIGNGTMRVATGEWSVR
jgi:lipopolysaccharide transport system ATP-binding protein